MKKYFVYVTINNISKKYYIGKHETDDVDDGYIGSGTALQYAIRKYGRESFSRIVLKYVDSATELNTLEKCLITEEIVNDRNSYNLALGGQGGNLIKAFSESRKGAIYKKISDTLKRKGIKPPGYDATGRTLSENHKRKIGNALRNKPKPERTEEHRHRISKSLKGRTISTTTRISISKSMQQNHANNKTSECPHCGKIGKSGSMRRWHFEKCKLKDLQRE